MPSTNSRNSYGWAGTGRMGFQLVSRLLADQREFAVYNRTRSKAEPLADKGAVIVDSASDLGGREIVFTMVAGSGDLMDLLFGGDGILSGDTKPRIIVDSTTISARAGEAVRATAAEQGVQIIAAPVSGNPSVVKSGKLTVCGSGPRDAWDEVLPLLEQFGRSATYVGSGEEARLVKVCHNLMLGVVAQCMAEITVLAEKGGVPRADFLAFLNDSVMGSMFTRYKTPAFVNLDFSPTFTPALLLKDFELGFDAARTLGVPLPVAATTAEIIQGMKSSGSYDDSDFAALLEIQARNAGCSLEAEASEVADGLAPERHLP